MTDTANGVPVQEVETGLKLLASIFGPVCSLIQRRQRSRKERNELESAEHSIFGHWKAKATYRPGRTRQDVRFKIPILRSDLFETYLKANDGHFIPKSQLDAELNWPKFVHALGITERTKVDQKSPWKRTQKTDLLRFRHPAADERFMSPNDIFLEIDGSILCHIINLFERQMPRLYGIQIDIDTVNQGTADVGFANITWDVRSTPPAISYDCADLVEISSDRFAFGDIGRQLKSENCQKQLMEIYDKAIEEGCSDSTLSWLDWEAPLKERIQQLQDHVSKVQERSEPVLLTCKWLEGADRVRRRATTKGGRDDRFLKNVLSRVDEGTWFQPAEWWLDTAEQDDVTRHFKREESILRDKVDRSFFFHEDRYSYRLDPPTGGRRDLTRSAEQEIRERHVRRVLLAALDRYREAKEPWLRQIYLAKNEVIQLMSGEKVIRCDGSKVRILRLDKSSKLWGTKVELRE